MSYHITYPGDVKTSGSAKICERKTNTTGIVYAVLCLIVLLGLLSPLGRKLAQNQQTVTKDALNCFVSNLESGESFENSFRIFCREVILNG